MWKKTAKNKGKPPEKWEGKESSKIGENHREMGYGVEKQGKPTQNGTKTPEKGGNHPEMGKGPQKMGPRCPPPHLSIMEETENKPRPFVGHAPGNPTPISQPPPL